MPTPTKADYVCNRRRVESANRRANNDMHADIPPHRREAAERECRRLGIDPRGLGGVR